jgi:Na+/H+-translocating membrane pyrophosphatase
MADVFESIAAEVIGTMILAGSLGQQAKLSPSELQSFIFFPLVIHSLDLVISSIGIFITKAKSNSEDALTSMKRAYTICLIIAATMFTITCRIMLYISSAPYAWMYYAGCGLVGIITSACLISITQYYTDYHYGPVKRIAAASSTGSGTNVIAGISVGLESTAGATCCIALALFISYTLGCNSGLALLNSNIFISSGVFGTAISCMGMLSTAVYVLSMNNFGPIADNAGGIVEMSGQSSAVRVITDRLDAVGNVTKAASKGYAVGGSALSCFVLFQAYLDEISGFISDQALQFNNINLARVEIIISGLLGMCMIFVFSGLAMSSVGRCAQKVVWLVKIKYCTICYCLILLPVIK